MFRRVLRGYYVTAGVFGSVTNANKLQARLSKQGCF